MVEKPEPLSKLAKLKAVACIPSVEVKAEVTRTSTMGEALDGS